MRKRDHVPEPLGPLPLVIPLLIALVLSGIAGCRPQGPEEQPQEPAAIQPAAPDDGASEPAPPNDGLPEGATHSIGEVLASPREGYPVILSGTITQILGDFNFMLGDGTDEVFVDGDDDFGALAVGDAVLVTGIVDVEDSPPRVEIEATAVVRN
jgi:uncharacterized protein YdeI (BOF family)